MILDHKFAISSKPVKSGKRLSSVQRSTNQGLVKSYLQAPTEFLLEQMLGGLHTGNKEAKVIILGTQITNVICASAAYLTELIKEYGGRVALDTVISLCPFTRKQMKLQLLLSALESRKI